MKQKLHATEIFSVLLVSILMCKMGLLVNAEPINRFPAAKAVSPKTMFRLSVIANPPSEDEVQSRARLHGYGEKAVVRSASGEKLLAAPAGQGIYSVKCSPSQQLAVIGFNDGDYGIYRLEPFKKIGKLPYMPDVPRASAFEVWDWVDKNTLVGISATERKEEELKNLTAAEQEARWRERTLIFIYTLDKAVLTEVNPSKVGLPASFDVVEVRKGGYLKAVWAAQDGTSKSLWIAVDKVAP